MIQDNPISGAPTGPATEDFWKTRSELAMNINNASIDGMMALDLDFTVIFWNPMAELWSGYRHDQAMGEPFLSVFPEAGKMSDLQDALHETLNGRKSFLPSASAFFLNGCFETHMVPLRNALGEINGVLLIIHDVADRVKAENQLKALNEQLQLQNLELRGLYDEMAMFAKVAAHDLKEPVRKVYTFCETIKSKEAQHFSDAGKSALRRMQSSTQRMRLLVDDVVSYLSLSNERGELQKVDLAQVLERVIADLKPCIEERNATIKYGRLAVVDGYPAALEHLFSQLLSNALKFHQPDVPLNIEIDCKQMSGDTILHEEALGSENYCRVSVRDNGIGFETEYSSKIFELFQQLHPGAYKGSGKGLAIARKAVRMHHGFIKAHSEPGKGSRFCCYFPTAEAVQ